jgi:hypothetical protein
MAKGKYTPGFHLEFKYQVGQELINMESGVVIKIVGCEVEARLSPVNGAAWMDPSAHLDEPCYTKEYVYIAQSLNVRGQSMDSHVIPRDKMYKHYTPLTPQTRILYGSK